MASDHHSTTKPTIIFVLGSWHVPAHLESLAIRLRNAGYNSVHIPSLPSIGTRPALTDAVGADAAVVRKILVQAIDSAGEDVVLVAHSYGGLPACEAASGYSKAEREARGLQGGVIRLVFIAAAVLEVGDNLRTNRYNPPESMNPKFANAGVMMEGEDHGLIAIRDAAGAHSVFYNDVDEEEAERWFSLLEPTSVSVSMQPLTYAAYRDIPSAYLICTNDNALSPAAQEKMSKAAGIAMVERVNSSHSPWLVHPEVVELFIRRAAGEVL